MPSEKSQQTEVLSTAVLQEDIKPHWPGESF